MVRSMRLGVIALFVLLTVSAVQAGGQAAGIRLEVPADSYRFEPVPEGTEIQHDFVLKNKGSVPAAILKVHTS